MTTEPEFLTQRQGEAVIREVDYGPGLGAGDYLTGAPACTAVQVGNLRAPGEAITLGTPALEPGDEPRLASVLVKITAAHSKWRIDCAGTTAHGERRIIPLYIEVLP